MENKSERKNEEKAASIVVATRVKETIKGHGCMMSGELVEALSAEVDAMIADACARTKKNGRSTVQPHDL